MALPVWLIPSLLTGAGMLMQGLGQKKPLSQEDIQSLISGIPMPEYGEVGVPEWWQEAPEYQAGGEVALSDFDKALQKEIYKEMMKDYGLSPEEIEQSYLAEEARARENLMNTARQRWLASGRYAGGLPLGDVIKMEQELYRTRQEQLPERKLRAMQVGAGLKGQALARGQQWSGAVEDVRRYKFEPKLEAWRRQMNLLAGLETQKRAAEAQAQQARYNTLVNTILGQALQEQAKPSIWETLGGQLTSIGGAGLGQWLGGIPQPQTFRSGSFPQWYAGRYQQPSVFNPPTLNLAYPWMKTQYLTPGGQ